MHEFDKLAAFVRNAEIGMLGRAALEQVKVRVLTALGAAIAVAGAHGSTPPTTISMSAVSGPGATAIGGTRTTVERAAFHNTALSACLDYTDSYVAWAGSCRPADCVAATMAAAEGVDAQGGDFLTAVALAYQIQLRLCEVKPVPRMEHDPCAALAYAVAVAAARVMQLDQPGIVRTIAAANIDGGIVPPAPTVYPISAEALAVAEATARGVAAAFRRKPYDDASQDVCRTHWFGHDIGIDWSTEPLDGVLRTAVKRHMADIRFQAAIDAAITIGTQPGFQVDTVRSVDVITFRAGDLGVAERTDDEPPPCVQTKTQARKSLPYVVAAALIDGEVQAPQFTAERIARPDVQRLLRKMRVAMPLRGMPGPFDAAPTQVTVRLYDDTVFCVSAPPVQGPWPRQPGWDTAWTRFERLVEQTVNRPLAAAIADCVWHLEKRKVRDLTKLLAQVTPAPHASTPAALLGCVG